MGRTTGPWLRYGCLTVTGLAVVILLVVGVTVTTAVRQNRSTQFEHHEQVQQVPRATAGEPTAFRLELDLHTAGAYIKPVEAHRPIRVEAEYDPRRHVLRQTRRRFRFSRGRRRCGRRGGAGHRRGDR